MGHRGADNVASVLLFLCSFVIYGDIGIIAIDSVLYLASKISLINGLFQFSQNNNSTWMEQLWLNKADCKVYTKIKKYLHKF